MKKMTTILLLAFCMGCSISAFAQGPPQPPGDPGSSGETVGGSAPIGNGLGILFVLSTVYSFMKTYRFTNNE